MTLHDATNASPAPVLKIGAVVVRAVASRQLPVASEDAASAVVPPPVGGRLGGGRYEDQPLPYTPPPQPSSYEGGSAFVAPHSPRASYSACGSVYEIIIIRPKPKTAGEVPPFVLPRGSRQYQDANGVWHDARDEETGARFADRLEPFARALEREVAEEAGVTSEMLVRAQVVELGPMEFASRSKGNYPIHWFLVIPAPADAALLDETLPEDATALQWARFDEIKAMAATGEFSAGYVPVIEVALARVDLPPPELVDLASA